MGPPAVTAPTTASQSARFVTSHSVLSLDARHPLVQKALLDPQIMHRLVMSGFYGWVQPTEKDPRALLGILSTWSLDLRENRLVLVVQSRVQADWSRIPGAALRGEIATLPVDMPIALGATFTFRTIVNPVRERDVVKDTAPRAPAGPRQAR